MNYELRKNIWLIFVALVFAAVAAWLAMRWMETRVDASKYQRLGATRLVVASHDVALGARIEPADVRVVSAISSGFPADAFTDTKQVIGQVVKSALFEGEVLTARRLARYTGGSSLAAVLAPGMRAVTVRVDDVIGVGGFVLPENRVDVVASYQDGGLTRAETVLRDIRVLAVDQRSDSSTTEPLLVRAVTLEVTPDGAETLAVASQRGRIQLTLLNPISANPAEPNGGGRQADVVVAAPKLVDAGVFVIRTPRLERSRDTTSAVTLIRGTEITIRKSE
jgi:pilus assembly protein CpaB